MDPDYLFTEGLFPPAADCRSAYEHRVELGRSSMRRSTAVICGLARDVGRILPATIRRVECLGRLFADYQVVIYENDSRDNTRDQLLAWAHRNPRVKTISETLEAPVNPATRCLNRAARMAAYRNRYLEVLRNGYADYDFAIVIDTDLRGGWSLEGIANSFGHNKWDFVGSNGLIYKRRGANLNRPLQYDAWAFRTDEQFTPLTTAEVNYMSWNRGEPLVPVTSCFGGLGVYRMEALLSAHYDGGDTEHVPLHQQIRQAGYRGTYLNPSQITVYGRHRRRSDVWAIPCYRTLAWFRTAISALLP